MKNSHQQRSGILKGILTPESVPSPNPSHQKQRSFRRLKPDAENVPPPDPNTVLESPLPTLSPAKPPATAKAKFPLPPRPPQHSLKRKLSSEALLENGSSAASDSGVQVIVRMRPLNKEEEEEGSIVKKPSANSLSILDHVFTFDSIADTESSQQDIFELVGQPLVENCLAGFNSSIFAYGQTGSGKTYTMWGPTNALVEENSSSNCQKGLTPRVFELLFARINEEQVKHADKELNYQCRCSFLEIYNEQITDLLDPNQRNLQIREDVKTGVYVDNLTEEYVCSMKDITKLLIKGLANRRTGATSINAESSRSHSVFTCVVESRCKSMSDGLSSLRTSRINLVDLAGSERQKLTGAAGERLKEAGNINRSLSQLGNLINILAEVSQSGKQRHIPYRDSRLTFLLQESLGGNARLAMICAISPSQSCKSETFSTLRFAQRAKAIKNKAVVNEVTQDDVNVLREVIRQLKEELLRMKSNGNSADGNGGYSTGWNARRSLNLLKMSLNRPRALPSVEHDSDEEMEIDEEDIERLCIEVGLHSSACDGNINNVVGLQSSACDGNINNVEKLPSQMDSQPQACQEVKDSNATCDGGDTEIQSHELKMNDISVSACASVEADINMEECQLEETALEEQDKHVSTGGHGQTALNAQLRSNSDKENFQCEAGNGEKCDDINTKIHYSGDAKPADEPGEDKTSMCTDSNSADEATVDKTSTCKDSNFIVGDSDSPNGAVAELSHSSPTASPESIVPSCLSIVPCEVQSVLQSPTSSISPRVNTHNSRKSLRISSMSSASKNDLSENIENMNSGSDILRLSFSPSLRGSANALSTCTSNNALASTEHLAASLHRGLQIMDSHQQSSVLRRSSLRFSFKPIELKPCLSVDKVDVGVPTYCEEAEVLEDSSAFVCSYCKTRTQLECKDADDRTELQLIPVDVPQSADKSRKQVPKAVEKVLTGAIRREMALEDICAKHATEIAQLNRLVQQYKHERECNAMIEQTREEKIRRLEGLMDGVLPTEDFMEEELVSLTHEHNLLKEKYEYHPEILRTKIELKRVQEELDSYKNFFDMGERDVLMEEIQDLRSQLQCYIDSSPMSLRKQSPLLQLTYPSEPISSPLCTIPESTEESAQEKLEAERRDWTEAESRWISLSEELRLELEASRSLAERQKQELDSEKKCSEELKEALQMAMQGHARILDQYAELQEKHIALLSRHRKIRDGIEDVKQAAARAGVRGAESKFINSLAAEISALKVEREKEKRYMRDENKALQGQLRDTAEAVQAAGELLVRLKEAEEAIAVAQNRAEIAEQEARKAHKEIDKLKKKHEKEIVSLNQLLAESRLPKEALRPTYNKAEPKYDDVQESPNSDQRWREEFEPFHGGDSEFSRIAEPSSWFAGYDRCNI